MKRFVLFLFCFVFVFSNTKADEGMWLPILIKKLKNVDLEKMGLQLSPEELYSVNSASLKDAIVSFSGYCTGEIISNQGLLLTNHHCGYDAIQNHSSVESDYLQDGFWAKNKSSELNNPGLFVDFLIRMEDVTERVFSGTTPDSSEEERAGLIQKNIQTITNSSTEGTHYWSRVKSFFGGNEFYLFVYERFSDVRLVGAPPESIGTFGGDTDNWMWPRHTGDFSLFRVYTAPDGMPAEYNDANIPLKPKHHLPISLNGVQENDFSMIFGYPGSTDRYLSSFGIQQALDLYNPTVVRIRTKILDVLRGYMEVDPAIKIKYASKKARVANYWKYYQGQSKQLKELDVYNQKVEIENRFLAFANKNAENKKIYGDVLLKISDAYKNLDNFVLSRVCLNEAAWGGSDAIKFSRLSTRKLLAALKSNNHEEIEREIKAMKKEVSDFFKEYDKVVDGDLFLTTLEAYKSICPKDQLPKVLLENSNLKEWRDWVYKKSMFVSEKKMNKFLNSPINMQNKIENDPIFKTQASIIDSTYFGQIYPAMNRSWSQLDVANKLFIEALMKMSPGSDFYSDANFTMRMTYGSVSGYATDNKTFNYKTYLDGVIKKMNNNDPEFVVPEKLVTLFKNKDFGQYEEDGSVPVCFVSNNDITGGNSGSPVINGEGHLIGCAFDGNWEGMSGDIEFNEKLNRTISVDVKYILFIIDKFAGAKHLIDELTLVKDDSKKNVQKLINKNKAKVDKKKSSFGEAFMQAVEAGLKTFTWEGRVYTTEIADPPHKDVVVE